MILMTNKSKAKASLWTITINQYYFGSFDLLCFKYEMYIIVECSGFFQSLLTYFSNRQFLCHIYNCLKWKFYLRSICGVFCNVVQDYFFNVLNSYSDCIFHRLSEANWNFPKCKTWKSKSRKYTNSLKKDTKYEVCG